MTTTVAGIPHLAYDVRWSKRLKEWIVTCRACRGAEVGIGDAESITWATLHHDEVHAHIDLHRDANLAIPSPRCAFCIVIAYDGGTP